MIGRLQLLGTSSRLLSTVAAQTPLGSSLTKPVCVVISWMGAKQKYIKKYKEHYDAKGFETIQFSPVARDVLSPSYGRARSLALVEKLSSPAFEGRPIVFHCFSTGGYIMGSILDNIERSGKDEHQRLVFEQTKAQVYDSVVDWHGVTYGLPRAVFPGRPTLQRSATALLDAMVSVARPLKDHWVHCSNHFHNNIITSPSLFFYSRNDPIATPHNIETVIDKWRKQGHNSVLQVAWEDSPHVAHAQKYPQEYWGTLDSFLEENLQK